MSLFPWQHLLVLGVECNKQECANLKSLKSKTKQKVGMYLSINNHNLKKKSD